MKKILFVIRSLEFGGAEKSLVNLLHELPEGACEVDLLLFKKRGDFLAQVPRWVRILEIPEALERLFAPPRKAGRYMPVKLIGTACAKLFRKTRKQRMAFRWRHFYKKVIPKLSGSYDAAVAYVGTEVLYYVADCVQAKKKYVWIHNDYRTASYSKEDDLPYLEKMEGIVSVSPDCVEVLRQEFPQFANKLHYLQNITSSAVVKSLADSFLPEEYTKTCNILSVGRLSRQKGFDLAIEACAILKQQKVDFCWYVIGTGDQEEKLKELIARYDVADCFRLLGTRSNPYPYMKHCTFLAQPSRFEGKSVVLDEAKILATPILATAYPTVADQIQDGLEGHIVDMTPEDIARGVTEMISNPAMVENIRQYLSAGEYGNQQEAEKYRKLMEI